MINLVFLFVVFLFPHNCIAEDRTVFHWPRSSEFIDNLSQTVGSPFFWAPLGVFALLQVENGDHHLERAIHREMPLFGQKHRAGEFSDSGRSILNVVMVASSIPLAWHPQHGEQFLFVMASDFVTQLGVNYSRKSLTSLYPRARPHDDGNDSMPSGHATSVSARTSLAMLNMQSWRWQGWWNDGIQTLSWTLAYTVAYARIEEGAHYPGDILVGMSWGFFWSQMIKRNLYNPKYFWPELSWSSDLKKLNLSMSF